MSPIPDPSTLGFETIAAACFRNRLEAHGHAPWSICEVRLSQDDYQRLQRWAATVTTSRIDDVNGDAGLVLLAFIAEWNRRNSPGDTVWVGLPPLFEVASTRRKLFTGNDQPAPFTRRTIRRA